MFHSWKNRRIHLLSFLLVSFTLFLFFLFLPDNPGFADVSQDTNTSMTIPSRLADYQFLFSADNNMTVIQQFDTVTYRITYGALPSAYFPTNNLTLVADFSDNLVTGQEIVSYVPGSATNAYNNTPPIIDLSNKTITWNISSLPAGAKDQMVTFWLQAGDWYRNTNSVPFSVVSSMSTQTLVFPNQIIQQYYKYNTNTQTSAATATPTPMQSGPPQTTTFSNISLSEVTSQNAQIRVITAVPVTLQLYCGTSPNTLTVCATNSGFSTDQTIGLAKLSAHTKYYFQLKAIDKNGNITFSDIYTLTTGGPSNLLSIDLKSLVLLSSNVILYLPSNTNDATIPTIVLPENVAYSFNFRLQNGASVKKAYAVVRNKNVLGITNGESQEPSSFANEIIQAAGGIFTGNLTTPPVKGTYQLFASFEDNKGNTVERLLANIVNLDPFTVKDKQTRQPIENAQITWYFKNVLTGQYTQLPADLFQGINNPDFTDRKGTIIVQFPQGEYKAEINAYGYKSQRVFFAIGPSKTQIYPTVYMQEEPFNIFGAVSYSVNIISQLFNNARLYLLTLANSNIYFKFIAYIVIGSFVLLTFSSFMRRIQVPIAFIFSYFQHIIRTKRSQKLSEKIHRQLLDAQTKAPIAKAAIFFIDPKTNRIVYHTATNAEGVFASSKMSGTGITVLAMKDGYKLNSFTIDTTKEPLIFELTKTQHPTSITKTVEIFIEKMFSILFESLLLISLTSEVALGYVLGFDKVYVFLTLSILNLILWILHLMHLRYVSMTMNG